MTKCVLILTVSKVNQRGERDKAPRFVGVPAGRGWRFNNHSLNVKIYGFSGSHTQPNFKYSINRKNVYLNILQTGYIALPAKDISEDA